MPFISRDNNERLKQDIHTIREYLEKEYNQLYQSSSTDYMKIKQLHDSLKNLEEIENLLNFIGNSE